MAFQCVVRDFLAAKEVKFSIRGFTILKGESSSGKSSSLKALYAAATNTFSPSQVRWGAESAVIKMRFNPDEPILTVERSKKGSPVVKFNGKEYSKIGRSVPEEIEKYLNIGFIQVGQDKYCLNFFTQFQPPLLHVFSQRRIAEILSSSPALDEYNMVTKAIQQRKEQLKGSFNSIDSLMSDIKERLTPNKLRIKAEKPLQENLTNLYKEYLSLESLVEQIKTLVQQSVYFSRKSLLIIQRRAVKDKLVELERLTELVQSCEELFKNSVEQLKTATRNTTNVILFGIYQDLEEIVTKVEFLRAAVDAFDRVDNINNSGVKAKSLISSYSLVESKFDELDSIKSTYYSVVNLQTLFDRRQTLLERIQLNNQLTNKDVCPYCGHEVCEEDMTKEEIVAKRKALQSQIIEDEKELAVLESKIKEGADKLGIEPTREAISAELTRQTTLMQEKESDVESALQELERLESVDYSVVETESKPTNHSSDSDNTLSKEDLAREAEAHAEISHHDTEVEDDELE